MACGPVPEIDNGGDNTACSDLANSATCPPASSGVSCVNELYTPTGVFKCELGVYIEVPVCRPKSDVVVRKQAMRTSFMAPFRDVLGAKKARPAIQAAYFTLLKREVLVGEPQSFTVTNVQQPEVTTTMVPTEENDTVVDPVDGEEGEDGGTEENTTMTTTTLAPDARRLWGYGPRRLQIAQVQLFAFVVHVITEGGETAASLNLDTPEMKADLASQINTQLLMSNLQEVFADGQSLTADSIQIVVEDTVDEILYVMPPVDAGGDNADDGGLPWQIMGPVIGVCVVLVLCFLRRCPKKKKKRNTKAHNQE